MKDSEKRRKNQPTLVEGFNNVPNLLEKARQVVDEVTQTAKERSGEAKPARHGKPKAAPPKKSAKETDQPKKPSRPAVPPEEPVTAAARPAPASRGEALWDLAYYGISVKHAIPGRIRLRLQKMLHNEALAKKLPPLLATVPGVTSVEASTATGSLLITFSSLDLAAAKSRQNLARVMHQFFPGLDTETLVKHMLHA